MVKKKNISEKGVEIGIDIPDGVEMEIEGNSINAKGEKGEISKTFKLRKIKVSKKDNKVVLYSKASRKRDLSLLGALKGDIKNMIHGVSEGVEYRLKILYSHFPMSVKVQDNKVMIENFIGEKHPRKADILEGVSVDVKGQDMAVSGVDKEVVAQTAANIEQATRIKGLDPRVFQDGCYIVEKDGKAF